MLFIYKPGSSSRGRGIFVFSKKKKFQKKDGIVQEYIRKPHLINNFKYDLRLYVVITGIDPLRIYIYNDGLIRFCSEKYSVVKSKLSNRF